jgi:hypothetical protein
MTVYVGLVALAGPFSKRDIPATMGQLDQVRNLMPILVAAFLAWRVTCGSWFFRGCMVAYTVLCVADVVRSPALQSGSLVALGVLVIYLAELALLVSGPVYSRTRKDRGSRTPVTHPWETPPIWLLAGALVGGILCTLVSLASMTWQNVPGCVQIPGGRPAACATLARGFPVRYLSAAPSVNLNSGRTVTPANLDVAAILAINGVAVAGDLLIWTLISFSAGYLIWVPTRRPAATATITQPVPI